MISHVIPGVRWQAAALVTGGALLLGCGQLPAAAYGSVSGTVMAGPTCPVEQAGNPCPNRPLQTTILVRSTSGHVVASTKSDGRGRYLFHIPPGTYVLELETGVWPRCPVIRIVVDTSTATRANIVCDTGIR